MALYSKCCNCGVRIPYRTTRCEPCTKEWNKVKDTQRNEEIKRFRNSKWWKNKSKQIMKQYHYQCQLCQHEGVTNVAKEVHHIVPLSVDFELRLEDSNLIPLCERCHDDVHAGEKNIPPALTQTF